MKAILSNNGQFRAFSTLPLTREESIQNTEVVAEANYQILEYQTIVMGINIT